MKKFYYLLAALFVIAVIVSLPGCGRDKARENALAGTREHADAESGLDAVCVLKDGGTGRCAMKVGDREVDCELRYEVRDGQLLLTFENSGLFPGGDTIDSAFRLSAPGTLIITDSLGGELRSGKK